jgi:hypothetical protein
MKGRTIRLFLVTGSTTGLRSAEVLNWTGKVFACPRSQLKELTARDEVSATGIYFLCGRDPNPPGALKVYVGESDDVAGRMKTHNSDQRWNFWEDTVVVVSKDEHLTKSHADPRPGCWQGKDLKWLAPVRRHLCCEERKRHAHQRIG